MIEDCSGGVRGDATRRNTFALKAAGWLALAASPTFAVMAVLTGMLHGNGIAMDHASPASGMVTMYLLMSAFHASAWLKLIRARGQAIVE